MSFYHQRFVIDTDHSTQTLDWFRHVHDGSLEDCYNSELFFSGLERVGGSEGDLLTMTRRRQLEQYQSRWSNLEFCSAEKISFDRGDLYDIVGGVFVWRDLKEIGTVCFLQLGSGARGLPRLEWRIQCPENFLGSKIDPASNVFVTLTPKNK